MHFSRLFPFVALASLATAQGPVRAIFYPEDVGPAFLIQSNLCVNFQRTQPIYAEIQVEVPNVCTLYATRDCRDPIQAYPNGNYDILELQFRSVQCTEEPQE
ncbi:hypothetical protein V496_05529 [Pseudogymnoascus sp. VKM F-4515 (FW-2607)]|nr:hypothetical protein V496_05529 [Pseudogymnoascus sp. VKM F-4515 (FW-2607)]KFY95487.1 hypothetical protein V498_03325 [Pseudogymnoascus sp. VKM F-4517 (FW-2822)]